MTAYVGGDQTKAVSKRCVCVHLKPLHGFRKTPGSHQLLLSAASDGRVGDNDDLGGVHSSRN